MGLPVLTGTARTQEWWFSIKLKWWPWRGKNANKATAQEHDTTAGVPRREAGSMPYCTRCGRQSPDEARFCSNCGLALAAGGRVEPPQDDSTSTISLTAIAAMDERGPDVMSPVDVEAINQLPRDSALLVDRKSVV